MNLRPHMVLVALLAAFAAWAQGPSFVYFRADAPLDASAYKMVLSQLMDLDPQAEVFHSDDMTILQVKRGAVSDEQLRAAITSTGVNLRPGTVDPATLQPAPVDGPPVFIVTDDPAADLARYQAAMAAWNAAHPDQPVGPPVHLQNAR
jgi:hypothetical protein